MHNAQKLAKLLRKQACGDYPKGCKRCGAKQNCGSRVEHRAAEELEALLYMHQLDMQEIVNLRRKIEAKEDCSNA